MAGTNVGFKAGGNISPCRFLIGSDQWTVTQASSASTTPPVGISMPWTRYAPGSAYDDGYIAQSGEEVPCFMAPDEGMIEAGNTITAFDLLKTDANGRAIPATTGTYYGAQALESATASGQRIRVKAVQGYKA